MNHPRKRAHSSCLALLLAGAIAFAPWTSAKAQVSPKGFGIGADVMLSAQWAVPLGVAGLAFNIWATPALLLQFLVQSQFVGHRRDDVQVLIAGGGGLFYTIARGDATALEIGGRFGVGASLWTKDRSEAQLGIDALLRVEHWLDRHFSVSGQVGIATGIAPKEDAAQPFRLVIGSFSPWTSVGFTYYFDPADGVRGMAQAPPVEAQGSRARAGTIAPSLL